MLKKEQNKMNKKIKSTVIKICAAALVLLAAGCFTACSKWDTPYKTLDKSGYTVSVRFDANGGSFAGSPEEVYVIDVFNVDNMKEDANGNKTTPLISPDDPVREDKAFGISKNGYYFAGWYSSRSPRVDEKGNALDEFGVPVVVSGKNQGYTYAGRWNFDTDLLKVDPKNLPESSEENVLTLYAAWIPYTVYEIYTPDENGDYKLAETVSAIELKLPEWNEKTGKLTLGKFPEIKGKTLDKIYYDKECTDEVTGAVKGEVDYESGTSLTQSVKLYTTWLDGDWYRITKADQLYKINDPSGHYVLAADVDFSKTMWPSSFATGTFKGSITSAEGSTYKISNVSVVQNNGTSVEIGGLFGRLDASASITNVTFENISYTINDGSRKPGATFGLLAGTVASETSFENVSVSGKLVIKDSCYAPNNYIVGLLFGSGYNGQIDISSIECEWDENSTKLSVEVDKQTGEVNLTFAL